MARQFVPGLRLSRMFYDDLVEPILRPLLTERQFSAGLLGYGSEVQGLDDVRSTDHAWGPRVQIFLDGVEHQALCGPLDEALERLLPTEYQGYPVRFAFPGDTAAGHWVHILDIREFFSDALGLAPDNGIPLATWLSTPAQMFRELTQGAVFHDGLGLLEPYRASIAWYPDPVWRYTLACQWMKLSQEEAFVGRCGEVDDDLGSAIITGRQVREIMRLCLLQHRVYPPYSKWLGSAFAALPCAPELGPCLSSALAASGWQERERWLTVAYEFVARAQNALCLTPFVNPCVSGYFGRPFHVLHAARFAEALLATIDDERLRQLPPVGVIDQYIDSTDLMGRNYLKRRHYYLQKVPHDPGEVMQGP